MLGELQKQKLTKVFRIWDTDNSGSLEVGDWNRISEKHAKLTGVGLDTPEYKNMHALNMAIWENLRELADTNRDERVSLEEWLAYCDRQFGALKQPDFQQLPEPTRSVFEGIIAWADENKDGRISFDDHSKFLAAWLGRDAGSEEKAAFQRRDQDGDGYISIEDTKQHVAEFIVSNDPESPGNWLFD